MTASGGSGSCIFTVLILITLAMETGSQGTGLFQTIMESAKNDSDLLFHNSADSYLKKLIPVTMAEETPSVGHDDEKGNNRNHSPDNKSIFSKPVLKGVPLPDLSLLGIEDDKSNSNNSISGMLPTTVTQGYVKYLMKPVQESGAEVVEGAVKTGVDQAVSSISKTFKLDIALIGAVFFVQIVLLVSGAHLYFYVYQRERAMRRYVEQQINVNRPP